MWLVAFLFFAAVCAQAQAGEHARDDWPTYGGDAGGQRYSPAKQITRSNVANLQVAWTMHTHALDQSSPLNWRAFFEATPVLWNKTLYFDAPFDKIFAVDAATGNVRWTFDPHVNRAGPIYIVAARGVALWHARRPGTGVCESDAVVVATLDRRLIARDARTGAACPHFGTDGSVDLTQGVDVAYKGFYSFTSPPTVVGDTIVLGSSVADNQNTFVASVRYAASTPAADGKCGGGSRYAGQRS
jgi:quinoprotein glucose dehydrogenase